MSLDVTALVRFEGAATPAEHSTVAAERRVHGSGAQTVWNHYADASGQFFAGVWQGEVGAWRVHYTEHEFCHLLEGRVALHDEAGGSATFVAGDSFVIPAGFSGTWEVLEPARKLYAIFEPKAG